MSIITVYSDSNNFKGKKRGSSLISVILLLIFIVGVGLIAYPSVSDYWNSFHQTRAIMSYTENIANMDNSQYDALFEQAYAYDRDLCDNGMRWNLEDDEMAIYNSQLDTGSSGNIGFITIDKINVLLPIYLGTSEAVLQTGIGHLEGSSLPVGCSTWDSKDGVVTDKTEGTHCLLSGHRGLPTARLFTDLNQLVEGDVFTINVLNDTLTYQVDQIRVVEPTDVSSLQIVKGRDFCTLITCTPYGINTHRLLVRGHRVVNAMGDVKVVSDALQIEPIYIVPFLAVPVLVLLVMMMFLDSGRADRHRRALRHCRNAQNDLLYGDKRE